MEAAREIRNELATEARTRGRRALLLFAILFAMMAGVAFGTGLKSQLGPQDLLVAAVGAAFVLFGAVVSFSPDLRFGRWAASGLALVAIVSPTFAALYLEEVEGPAWGKLGCFTTIVAVGVVAVVMTRLVLGSTRRRFGGASRLQAVAAALAAAVGVGLHCEGASLLHLVTHTLAAAVIVGVVGKLVLR
ncbi:MAG: hypothetical protein RIT81_37330 [Deltaproteobacteria bacterium]